MGCRTGAGQPPHLGGKVGVPRKATLAVSEFKNPGQLVDNYF